MDEKSVNVGSNYGRNRKYNLITNEQRKSLIEMYKAGEGTLRVLSKRLNINLNTCLSILRIYDQTGRIDKISKEDVWVSRKAKMRAKDEALRHLSPHFLGSPERPNSGLKGNLEGNQGGLYRLSMDQTSQSPINFSYSNYKSTDSNYLSIPQTLFSPKKRTLMDDRSTFSFQYYTNKIEEIFRINQKKEFMKLQNELSAPFVMKPQPHSAFTRRNPYFPQHL